MKLSFNFVSQTAHVLAGMLGVLGPIAIWHISFIPGTVGVLSFAVVKEFWFDVHFEDAETSGGLGGDIQDFGFYLAGILAANILLLGGKQ